MGVADPIRMSGSKFGDDHAPEGRPAPVDSEPREGASKYPAARNRPAQGGEPPGWRAAQTARGSLSVIRGRRAGRRLRQRACARPASSITPGARSSPLTACAPSRPRPWGEPGPADTRRDGVFDEGARRRVIGQVRVRARSSGSPPVAQAEGALSAGASASSGTSGSRRRSRATCARQRMRALSGSSESPAHGGLPLWGHRVPVPPRASGARPSTVVNASEGEEDGRDRPRRPPRDPAEPRLRGTPAPAFPEDRDARADCHVDGQHNLEFRRYEPVAAPLE